jgi:uncharacterized protein with FMN-binding domain
MRRALPAALATVTGLAAVLRVQHAIDFATVAAPAPAAPTPAAGAGDPDAAVTGPAVPTPFGSVQVAAVVRAGRLADVRALKAPDDNPNSQRINAMALPVLQREAVAAQSARIDTVAGATLTSDAYRSSLQAAIDTAATAPTTTALLPTPSAAPPGPATTGPPVLRPASTSTTRPTGTGTGPGPAPGPTTTVSGASGPSTTSTVARPPGGGAGTTTFGIGPVVPIATGPVQAWVAVSGGRIAQVQALLYPTGNPTSSAINAEAVPRLLDQVLATQSARGIQAVSGATLTSEAFRASLQAALDGAAFTG